MLFLLWAFSDCEEHKCADNDYNYDDSDANADNGHGVVYWLSYGCRGYGGCFVYSEYSVSIRRVVGFGSSE